MRVLSGIQPSGNPHLGNYLGAMKQHIEMQQEHECFYFIADLHALTTVRDAEQLHKNVQNLAIDYLALGLNPNSTVFFRQSDLPEHSELAWILDCITPMGLLERAHAWKNAKTKGKKEATVGLFNYPVLMAADILLYESDLVPVGQDQKQHIEMARDIATHFNVHFEETFKLPEAYIKPEVATVIGTDGQKMSKSYGNVIEIFADEAILKKQVFSIITDSKSVNEPKDPEKSTIVHLYEFFAKKEETDELKKRFKNGKIGYGDAKQLLYEKLLEYFAHERKKRIELEKNLSYVEKVLEEGAKKARKVAAETLERVRKKIGIGKKTF